MTNHEYLTAIILLEKMGKLGEYHCKMIHDMKPVGNGLTLKREYVDEAILYAYDYYFSNLNFNPEESEWKLGRQFFNKLANIEDRTGFHDSEVETGLYLIFLHLKERLADTGYRNEDTILYQAIKEHLTEFKFRVEFYHELEGVEN